jgi:hypothetical protein
MQYIVDWTSEYHLVCLLAPPMPASCTFPVHRHVDRLQMSQSMMRANKQKDEDIRVDLGKERGVRHRHEAFVKNCNWRILKITVLQNIFCHEGLHEKDFEENSLPASPSRLLCSIAVDPDGVLTTK